MSSPPVDSSAGSSPGAAPSGPAAGGTPPAAPRAWRSRGARSHDAATAAAARAHTDEVAGNFARVVHTSPYWVHRRQAGIASRGLAFLVDLVLLVVSIAFFYYLTASTLRLMGVDIETCRSWVPVTDATSLIANLCRAIRGTTRFLMLTIAPVYLFTLWIVGGQTIGMMVAGIKVVRSDGTPVRPRHALLRLAGLAASLLALGVGLLWAAVDRQRQGWHDRLSGTYVLYWRRDIAYKETHGYFPERRARNRKDTDDGARD